MRAYFILFLSLSTAAGLSQEVTQDFDYKYLEDQFYLGLTYNILLNRPEGVSQRNLSYGLQGGFIKDLPINKARNIGFGIGLGYALNSYYSNIQAIETGNGVEYQILDGSTPFNRSKFETNIIEAPIEFRWRTSDPYDHRFWRIYSGVKLGYVFSGRSKFVSDQEKVAFSNSDIRSFQYGIIFSIGYNTFNFHAYLALNDLLEEGTTTVDGVPLELRPLHIGLIFYIL